MVEALMWVCGVAVLAVLYVISIPVRVKLADKAFEKAVERNKPFFRRVGQFVWCHVPGNAR